MKFGLFSFLYFIPILFWSEMSSSGSKKGLSSSSSQPALIHRSFMICWNRQTQACERETLLDHEYSWKHRKPNSCFKVGQLEESIILRCKEQWSNEKNINIFNERSKPGSHPEVFLSFFFKTFLFEIISHFYHI